MANKIWIVKVQNKSGDRDQYVFDDESEYRSFRDNSPVQIYEIQELSVTNCQRAIDYANNIAGANDH